MKIKFTGIALAALAGAGLFSSLGVMAISPMLSKAVPSNFANEAFKNVWTRTDALVDNGSVKRGYYWGPVPGFSTFEDYAEGAGGRHQVQYFDKSRMELNNPAGDKNNPFYVTNGLLTRELISGQMQVGNNRFVTRYPAQIDIASDTDDMSAPTYASFQAATQYMRSYDQTGTQVSAIIGRSGFLGTDTRYLRYNVRYSYFETATQRNIPDVFWQFLNQAGPVLVDGKVQNARLSDPYFYATGYPIAEAYWASVKIADRPNTDVLIQPYERRVLTYVPSAPEGFKVQMGNIGQHYYDWRYKNAGMPSTSTKVPTTPVTVVTPTPPKCSQPPVRGFGKIWTDNPGLMTKLGCPYGPEQPLTVVYQPFERGYMVDVVQVYAHYGGYSTVKTIYALFSDGAAQGFPDAYVDGSPEPALSPPQGLYTPVRGFGKVWREQTQARVRERLGWATAPETVADANLPMPPLPPPAIPTVTVLPTATRSPVPPGQPTPVPGGGAYQEFERGIMVYTGPATRKILVFFSSSYGGNGIYGGQVFDDTFSGP